MDLDFLTGLAEIGSRGGRWKSFSAILFAVLGAGVGGYLGYDAEGLRGALGGGFAGGVLGWFLVAILSGVFLILALMLVIGLAAGFWIWLTGGAP